MGVLLTVASENIPLFSVLVFIYTSISIELLVFVSFVVRILPSMWFSVSCLTQYLFILLLNQGTSKGTDQKVPVLAAATLNLADFASLAGEKEDGIEIFVPLEASVGRFKSCLSLCVRETKAYFLFALSYSCSNVNISFDQSFTSTCCICVCVCVTVS